MTLSFGTLNTFNTTLLLSDCTNKMLCKSNDTISPWNVIKMPLVHCIDWSLRLECAKEVNEWKSKSQCYTGATNVNIFIYLFIYYILSPTSRAWNLHKHSFTYTQTISQRMINSKNAFKRILLHSIQFVSTVGGYRRGWDEQRCDCEPPMDKQMTKSWIKCMDSTLTISKSEKIIIY